MVSLKIICKTKPVLSVTVENKARAVYAWSLNDNYV